MTGTCNFLLASPEQSHWESRQGVSSPSHSKPFLGHLQASGWAREYCKGQVGAQVVLWPSLGVAGWQEVAREDRQMQGKVLHPGGTAGRWFLRRACRGVGGCYDLTKAWADSQNACVIVLQVAIFYRAVFLRGKKRRSRGRSNLQG